MELFWLVFPYSIMITTTQEEIFDFSRDRWPFDNDELMYVLINRLFLGSFALGRFPNAFRLTRSRWRP
jgi:hypothetical protein